MTSPVRQVFVRSHTKPEIDDVRVFTVFKTIGFDYYKTFLIDGSNKRNEKPLFSHRAKSRK